MARTRRTLRTTAETFVPDPEPILVEDEEVKEEEEEIDEKPLVKKNAGPARKDVTVILQECTSLTVAGQRFIRNQPVLVPANRAKFFRDHGWFRVV